MTPTIKWPQRLQEPVELPGANEIRLWQADPDELPASGEILFRTLSSSEQERARRFVFENGTVGVASPPGHGSGPCSGLT